MRKEHLICYCMKQKLVANAISESHPRTVYTGQLDVFGARPINACHALADAKRSMDDKTEPIEKCLRRNVLRTYILRNSE